MKYIVTRGLKTMEFETAEGAATCIVENIPEDGSASCMAGRFKILQR